MKKTVTQHVQDIRSAKTINPFKLGLSDEQFRMMTESGKLMECPHPVYMHEHNIYRPCGQCRHCLIAKKSVWKDRQFMEIQSSKGIGAFTTLTYTPENMPKHGSLVREHLSTFLKGFRENIRRIHKKLNAPNVPPRYFACGEVGALTHRPHYHLNTFNYGRKNYIFTGNRTQQDKKLLDFYTKQMGLNRTRARQRIMQLSDFERLMFSLWPYGNVFTLDIKDGATDYVASHQLKHLNIDPEHRFQHDDDKHEKSFQIMSTSPALGTKYVMAVARAYKQAGICQFDIPATYPKDKTPVIKEDLRIIPVRDGKRTRNVKLDDLLYNKLIDYLGGDDRKSSYLKNQKRFGRVYEDNLKREILGDEYEQFEQDRKQRKIRQQENSKRKQRQKPF